MVSYPQQKFTYALVGAYRGADAKDGSPMKIFPIAVPIKAKDQETVAQALQRMITYIEALHTKEFAEGKRVMRVLSDRGGEFENGAVDRLLLDNGIQHDFTSGHSPQSTGAAEVSVRILKGVLRRLLLSANMKASY